jgi:hypothetical protein
MNMNNKTVAGALLLILVIAGVLYYFTDYRNSHTGTVTDRTASSTTMDAIGVTDEGKEVPVTVTMNPTVAITQADNNTSVRIKKGSTVVVALGEDVWTLAIKPEGMLESLKGVAAIPGVQGVYTTNKVGNVTISGEGRPNCKSGEMCAQYIVNFTTTIVVVK